MNVPPGEAQMCLHSNTILTIKTTVPAFIILMGWNTLGCTEAIPGHYSWGLIH